MNSTGSTSGDIDAEMDGEMDSAEMVCFCYNIIILIIATNYCRGLE